MVKIIESDIFESGADIIAHCANCFCTMGSGIALEIRKRYPEAYDADLATKSGDREKLGGFSIAKVKFKDKSGWIFNLYAQYEFGSDKRQVDYEAFYSCLESMRGRIVNNDLIIAFPYKIASDRAGGSWKVIEAMIRDVFENSPFTVLICKLPDK